MKKEMSRGGMVTKTKKGSAILMQIIHGRGLKRDNDDDDEKKKDKKMFHSPLKKAVCNKNDGRSRAKCRGNTERKEAEVGGR